MENPEKNLSSFRYAFVSRYLSILEAMASRRLVFALYDNDVKRDYLLMTPFSKNIVACRNFEDLASQVIHYYKNPTEEQIITEKAYTWAKNQTWDSLVGVYKNLWER